MPETTSTTQASDTTVHVRLDDLKRQLLFPKLVRAMALSLRPERVLFGVSAMVLIGLIGSIGQLWRDSKAETPTPIMIEAIGAWFSAPTGPFGLHGGVVQSFASWFGRVASLLMMLPDAYPISTWALGIPMVIVAALFGGAIARSAACEFAADDVVPWPAALGFALRKSMALIFAVLIPLAVVWGVRLVIAVLGLAFWLPGLDIAAAVLYPIGLILGFFAAAALVGYVLGQVLLVPAIACEGTDALDSVQRAYAYVFNRPLTLAFYLFIAAVLGWVLVFATGLVLDQTKAIVSGSVGAFFDGHGETAAKGVTPTGDGVAGTRGTTAEIVEFWRGVVSLVFAGVVFSYIHTAGTLVYLLVRRVNDGQDIQELWYPLPAPGAVAAPVNTPTAETTAPAPAADQPASDAGESPEPEPKD